MATVAFFMRGKKNPSPIHVRFSISRVLRYRTSTEIFINPDYFDNGKIRNVAAFKDKDSIKLNLARLEKQLLDEFSMSKKNSYVFNDDWLVRQINKFHDRTEDIDLQYLDNYTNQFVDNLPNKISPTGQIVGVSEGTLKKYNTIRSKILGFQEYKKKRYRFIEIDSTFNIDLYKYLRDVERLGTNTVGRYIKFIKTIILDAEKNEIRISKHARSLKGFSEEIEKIYLSFDELDKIERTNVKINELDTAKDWLIIGCYIGQRIGDVLALTSKNIKSVKDLDFIELIQEKTKKKVMVLIHPKVRDILNKRSGEFPGSFAKSKGSKVTMFNRYIKRISQLAGLTELTEGAKINPETKRKETGIFPKWELVTSHICRRSFATNYYGHVPTPFLMEITGHSREKDFLNYIGKKPIDYAEEMLKYWKVAIEEQERKSNLKVV